MPYSPIAQLAALCHVQAKKKKSRALTQILKKRIKTARDSLWKKSMNNHFSWCLQKKKKNLWMNKIFSNFKLNILHIRMKSSQLELVHDVRQKRLKYKIKHLLAGLGWKNCTIKNPECDFTPRIKCANNVWLFSANEFSWRWLFFAKA